MIKETQITVFKDLFKSTDAPFIIPLEKSLERIRVGKSNNVLREIRKGNKELKKKLPCIVFAGEFAERNGKGLIQHSGLMVVDFDKYPDTDTMNEHLDLLKQNKHFVGLFISPSGNGIKGVVRVSNELDKETHPKIFKAFQKEFNYDYFDISGSDINRVCFESYDPNIYINYDAEIFDAKIIDDGYKYSDKSPLLPINDEDTIVTKIMNFDWKTDYSEGNRNNYIFNIAGAFCEYGVSQTTAESFILNHIIGKDFSERETLTAIKSAYVKRSFDSKFFENYTKIDRIKHDLKYGKKEVVNKYKINDSTYESIKEAKEEDDFWYRDKKNNVKIDPYKYKTFLERKGFKKYYPNGANKPIWVRVKANIVKPTSVEKLKDLVLTYLLDKGEIDVWKLCVNYSALFSEQYLLMLDSIELMMLKDAKAKSFIAYQNCILEVTKDSINKLDYIDSLDYIWESHIIKRDFEVIKDNTNDYKEFISNISAKKPKAIECVIGYLLSTYKNKMNNKVVILNDEVISDNPEGGTGKGLFIQGVKQIRKTHIIDGKSFNSKTPYQNQSVSIDDKILVFDDIPKNFSLEEQFSLITEGITIRKLYSDPIKLSVEESPKMVISTNYAVKGEGNSHDRRRHEIEIAQYYGKDLTPYEEFGEQLFDDWNDDTFLKFDNYMVYCLQQYLQFGLIKQEAKNLTTRKFIAETSMEFKEWISDKDNFSLNVRNDKADMFNQFVEEYQDYKRWLSRKKFNIWVQKYASYINAEYKQGNTNGSRWMLIKAEGQETPELEVEF